MNRGSFRQFFRDQGDWSQRTFGPDPVRGEGGRGPVGPLKHLAKEVQEALADPTDLEEYADLVFLVFDATRRAGFNYDELLHTCWYKLAKNRRRKWATPPAGSGVSDEPVEHVR